MTDVSVGSRDVSRLQDLFVTTVVALIGTAVSLGIYLQGGFGVIPSLCVGSGLFIWLLSAHFLVTRMRLKKLIDGRLAQLTNDVNKLKQEVEVTDLLAEGHNDIVKSQDALEKALHVIVSRIDQYDNRLRAVYKFAKQKNKKGKDETGEGQLVAADKRKLDQLSRQCDQLSNLQVEFERLSGQLQNHQHRSDIASMQHYTLMRAQLDVLELVVKKFAEPSSAADGVERSRFAEQALEAIRGLRHMPMGEALHGAAGDHAALSAGYVPNRLAGAAPGFAHSPQAAGSAIGVDFGGSTSGGAPMAGTAINSLDALKQTEEMRRAAFSGEAASQAGMPPVPDYFSERTDLPSALDPQADLTAPLLPLGAGTLAGGLTTQNSASDKMAEQASLSEEGGEDISAFEEETLLAAINEAIDADRIDLYLQPIVSLPDRALTYYEAFSRLRNELDQLIAPKDFLPVAEMAELTPIIDNQIILRVIQVVQRLVERGKGRVVFCNLSINSLRDAEFFAEFMDFMEANQWLSDHLVFELTQEAVDNAGSYEEERMAAIAQLGFRFSMDQINRLDIDFKGLAEKNFAFIKVHAGLLLGSMDGSKTVIHSADLSHYLKRLNITMIVDMVEREAVVRQLRDYNVGFAQGLLFCEPKPVRPEVLEGQSIVAA